MLNAPWYPVKVPGKRRRTPLDADTVVRAAFEVLDRDGLDGLTVRSIADRLGVQNPALYWHVRSKQEIVDRMAARLLADAVVAPPADGAWQAWLVDVARAFRRVMLAHRDGARVLASANLSQSPMLGNVEAALGLLAGAGFAPRDALIGILAVFDYTLGATFEEQADPIRGAPAASAAAPGRAPSALLVTASAALEGDAVFDGGVRLIVDGLATRLGAPTLTGTGPRSARRRPPAARPARGRRRGDRAR